jgi:hypothetical protein
MRLAQSGKPLEEAVTAGEERHDHRLHKLILPDERCSNRSPELLETLLEEAEGFGSATGGLHGQGQQLRYRENSSRRFDSDDVFRTGLVRYSSVGGPPKLLTVPP